MYAILPTGHGQMRKILKPIEAKNSDSPPFGSDALLQSAPGVSMRSADGTLNTRTGATGKDKVLGVPLVKETYRSQKSLKTNRLRGRIETAKQIDQNFDQKESGSNNLMLDTDEFKALSALKSFLNIPAISLGLVNPVEEGVVDDADNEVLK